MPEACTIILDSDYRRYSYADFAGVDRSYTTRYSIIHNIRSRRYRTYGNGCVVAPPGDQLYEPPGTDTVALTRAVLPWHILVSLTATEGGELMITLPDPLVALQPGAV